MTIPWTWRTTLCAFRRRPTRRLAKATNPVKPRTKPARLLNANNNATAKIIDREMQNISPNQDVEYFGRVKSRITEGK